MPLGSSLYLLSGGTWALSLPCSHIWVLTTFLYIIYTTSSAL
jgi:hypothetical protein